MNNKDSQSTGLSRTTWIIGSIVAVIIIAAIVYYMLPRYSNEVQEEAPQEIVINEAVRTLLYLPLYHAVESGFFEDNGVTVEIVTGGTATNSFAAMLSGEAEFSQADPMYVPISRSEGARTVVVAQVVARIAVWALTMDSTITDLSANALQGKVIATHPSPMTAYTYTVKAIRDAGLEPEKDVRIEQLRPGSELIPLLEGKAAYSMTLEPNVSQAVQRGAKVVLSYPDLLGDQIFTGLMTRQDYIDSNRESVLAVMKAYQQSLTDIRNNPDAALASARAYFPQLDEETLQMAIARMIEEQVIPNTIAISRDSWDKAVAVRVSVGDLNDSAPLETNVALTMINEMTSQLSSNPSN